MPDEISLDEYRAMQRRGRPSKYNNVRTETMDGRMADSAMEARRWNDLLLMERAGLISDLTFHPRYTLAEGVTYEADAAYFENGKWVIEDTKGVQTAVFRIKWKLLKAKLPDAVLRLWKER